MDIKPDFENYSLNQLKESLSGIDCEAYPERVEEIKKWMNVRNNEAPEAISKFVGFWIRFVAYLVDGLIIAIVFSAVYFVTFVFYGDGFLLGSDIQVLIVELLLSLVLQIGYFVPFWVYVGATPGKMLIGIRVVDEKTEGPITIWQGVRRCLSYQLSSFLMCLGFIWAAWHPQKKGWHDMLARTVVVWADDSKK